MMTEIFYGILSGGDYGQTVREHKYSEMPMNLVKK